MKYCILVISGYNPQQIRFHIQQPQSRFRLQQLQSRFQHDIHDHQFRFHLFLAHQLDYRRHPAPMDPFMAAPNLMTTLGSCRQALGGPHRVINQHPCRRHHQFVSIALFLAICMSPEIPSELFQILIRLNREYPKHKIAGAVQAILRFENGDVQSITTLSQDGLIEFNHAVDLVTATAVETSMTPFLDNGHVDKAHKYRVQFQGAHNLTIAKNENQGQRFSRIHCLPKYTLLNKPGRKLSIIKPNLTDF
jgi:hypothetical protein